MIVDPTFATPTACAGCHQFAFPSRANDAALGDARMMQRTIDEWRASPAGASGTACASCHMPYVGQGSSRHRSHAFPGVDSRMISRAIRVDARTVRDGDEVVVTLSIVADRIGHAFPTGDLFRTVEATLTVGGRVRDRARLSRVWGEVEGVDREGRPVMVRSESRDDRVQSRTAREVSLHVRAAPGDRIAWAIDHLRTTPAIARKQGLDVGATRAAEGEIIAP
jgi:hypothetical protein